jgi:Icc protein
MKIRTKRRRKNLPRRIKKNSNNEGIDRRGFLECMAWIGTGMIWTVSGGVLSSKAFGQMPNHQMGEGTGFSFVQISDSHIGFNKEANKDVTDFHVFLIKGPHEAAA